MFSLNVPLPSAVDRLAERLRPELDRFDRIRERRTLVCKRLGVDVLSDPHRPPEKDAALSELRSELRPLVRGTGPFRVEITGIDAFPKPTAGPGPVVYLAVESEPLIRLHWRLVRAFGGVEGIEGDAYVPHVTLARGIENGSNGFSPGSNEFARHGGPDVERELERLRSAAGEIHVEWQVDELELWDPEFREAAGRIRL
ncbi:phosphoesterase [Halalkaliarchaeum desulfuricum]|uniref:Phosphoesterase n=1 Tax=Halalkaliarchaeum desulfuricum TaxID=2055893 RepID=A0A343TP59_9EURY|nr:2'-5' RNA ligase family protein [Halalkaliarchaeum desulfuricum]AUX10881.1 phosphoesterase [Halalkaliarchaeum desulfuricum]